MFNVTSVLTTSYSLVRKNIERPEFNPLLLEQPTNLSRESTPRDFRVPLHEEHDMVLVHQLLQPLLKLLGRLGIIIVIDRCSGFTVGL